MTAPASLLVNKRKLPALLRHDVPPLRLAGTTVEPLVATRSRLWGVLHSDVGKKILHRGQAVAILNVHQNTRLVVRTNEEEHKAFWIPRRPTDRTQFNIERMWRSRRSHTLRAPVWTGEPRPNVQKIQLRTNHPSSAHFTFLVRELGYSGHAAFAAMVRGHLPWLQLMDRRNKGLMNKNGGAHPEHPYFPAAPNQRTTRGGGYRMEQVTAAIARHRWDDKHASAVFEIVYLRRKPFLVAASHGLKKATVYQYCSRVAAALRQEAPADEVLDSLAENSNPLVFSECV